MPMCNFQAFQFRCPSNPHTCLGNREIKLRKHQKRLNSTRRTLWMMYASMMVGALECCPQGILQVELGFFLFPGLAFLTMKLLTPSSNLIVQVVWPLLKCSYPH